MSEQLEAQPKQQVANKTHDFDWAAIKKIICTYCYV